MFRDISNHTDYQLSASLSRWLDGLIQIVSCFHHPWNIGFPGNFQYDDKKQLDLSEWNITPQLLTRWSCSQNITFFFSDPHQICLGRTPTVSWISFDILGEMSQIHMLIYTIHQKMKWFFHMGVSKNSGTPKWMIYKWKSLLKWMIWREKPLFSETRISTGTKHPCWSHRPMHLGDHWTEGPKRTVAMRQTHTVQLVQPSLGCLTEVVDMIYQMLGQIYQYGSKWWYTKYTKFRCVVSNIFLSFSPSLGEMKLFD